MRMCSTVVEMQQAQGRGDVCELEQETGCEDVTRSLMSGRKRKVFLFNGGWISVRMMKPNKLVEK